MKVTVYSIGYQMRSLPDLITTLTENKVEFLADLRANPYSRRHGFSRKTLASALETKGIEYIHFESLGTPQEIRDMVRSSGDYDRFFEAYRNHLETQDEALKSLYDIAVAHRTCLLCYELDVNQCHRKVVAERLVSMSGGMIEAVHL